MKVQFKGILQEFMPIKELEKGVVTELIFFKPGYVNEFGDKVGKDEFIPVTVFADKMDDLKAYTGLKDKKCEVSGYLHGRSFEKKDGTGQGFALSLNLKEVKEITQAQQQAATAPAAAGTQPTVPANQATATQPQTSNRPW